MEDRIKILEETVRKALVPVIPSAKVGPVEIAPGDEDGTLTVLVHIGKAKQNLPKDILLTIVNTASDAIADTGEERFPVVFGRFAASQDFAA